MKIDKLSMVLAAGLFLSLSVNFFLAGLMLGDAYAPAAAVDAAANTNPKTAGDDRRAKWARFEEQMRVQMSPDDIAVMEQSKKDNQETFDALRAQLDTARDNVNAAMAADPFDQVVVDAAIENEVAVKAAFVREMHRVRQETMSKLSPEGRSVLQKLNPSRRGGRGAEGGDKPPHAGAPDYRNERPGERIQKLRERFREERRLPEAGRPSQPPPGSPPTEDRPPPSVTDMP